MKKLRNVIRTSLKHAQSWLIGNVERLVAYTEMSTYVSHLMSTYLSRVTSATCTADTNEYRRLRAGLGIFA